MLTSCEVKLVSQSCGAEMPQRSLGLCLQELRAAWVELLPMLQLRSWPAVWPPHQYLSSCGFLREGASVVPCQACSDALKA